MTLEERAVRIRQLQAKEEPHSELLAELADTVALLCHQVACLGTTVDGINESLGTVQQVLEAALYEEEPDAQAEYFDAAERAMYEVKCPQCGEFFAVDECSLSQGFSCPSCGEHLIQAD